ncbi:hypothetical protein PIIN_10634 [Serendipita indica DSM 11827]|uniref:Uncharacterized protein n=1 Tax=Serendipita indica (strain DSM 11827) TaxID=1109443 RepID=G4TZA0_SERID|nr:hypothetical protein PIIN_10634 [Serendipita indica DSM 11827]
MTDEFVTFSTRSALFNKISPSGGSVVRIKGSPNYQPANMYAIVKYMLQQAHLFAISERLLCRVLTSLGEKKRRPIPKQRLLGSSRTNDGPRSAIR